MHIAVVSAIATQQAQHLDLRTQREVPGSLLRGWVTATPLYRLQQLVGTQGPAAVWLRAADPLKPSEYAAAAQHLAERCADTTLCRAERMALALLSALFAFTARVQGTLILLSE